MNHMNSSQFLVFRAGILMTALAVTIIWLAGCGDERIEPLQPGGQSHTETIVLWDDTPASNNAMISAGFTVSDTLAEITNPTEDTPARLLIVVYIRPDCQILRREQIVNETIPAITDDRILPALISIDSVKQTLDSLGKARLDSVERIQRAYVDSALAFVDYSDSTTSFGGLICDTALYTFRFDTASPFPDSVWARRDSILNLLPASLRIFEDEVLAARIDTAVFGVERDELARIVDNRYTLALWLDDTTTAPAYPEAVYDTLMPTRLTEQEIYLAATDTATGYKSRGFQLDLNQFDSADPINPGYTREVNWTTCFPGSDRPCLSQGNHTFFARVSGGGGLTRVSATLVLVYERSTP